LHDTRIRIRDNLIHPEDPHAHDDAQRFYASTVKQLSQRRNEFTEVEAIACLHLLSFWLFCGGGGDWAIALELAGDWLNRSDICKRGRDPAKVRPQYSQGEDDADVF